MHLELGLELRWQHRQQRGSASQVGDERKGVEAVRSRGSRVLGSVASGMSEVLLYKMGTKIRDCYED